MRGLIIILIVILALFIVACSNENSVTGNVVLENKFQGPVCVKNGCVVGPAVIEGNSFKCSVDIKSNDIVGVVSSQNNMRECT